MMRDSWPLLGLTLLLAAPGPTNFVLATAGAERGWRRGAWLVLIALAAYLAGIGAVQTVLALWPGEVAARAIRGIAVLCLCLIAFRLWRAPAAHNGGRGVSAPSVALVTLFNPKILVISAFMPASQPFAIFALLFGPLFAAIGGFYLALGGVMARSALRLRLIQRIAAVVLMIFAGLALWSALRPL